MIPEEAIAQAIRALYIGVVGIDETQALVAAQVAILQEESARLLEASRQKVDVLSTVAQAAIYLLHNHPSLPDIHPEAAALRDALQQAENALRKADL